MIADALLRVAQDRIAREKALDEALTRQVQVKVIGTMLSSSADNMATWVAEVEVESTSGMRYRGVYQPADTYLPSHGTVAVRRMADLVRVNPRTDAREPVSPRMTVALTEANARMAGEAAIAFTVRADKLDAETARALNSCLHCLATKGRTDGAFCRACANG
jgi:hypothetical protein